MLKAQQCFQKCKDALHLAVNLNSLGKVYFDTKQTALSFNAHSSALTIFKKLSNAEGEAATLGYLGHYYEKKKMFKEALTYQNNALEIYHFAGHEQDLQHQKPEGLLLTGRENK